MGYRPICSPALADVPVVLSCFVYFLCLNIVIFQDFQLSAGVRQGELNMVNSVMI